ncbi:cytochrome C biogenesis protein ResB [Williamsia sp. Leaf354]|jgi:cytochrome c biogenesis protein|uniref:cytochrome c biogenesis protein ResB n=1 Tax=Williamsia sp. Leaf354 TaxID=1736349 RepID=UPI0006F88D2C|nr:cytochrome c biogenesis protein ResB [Williamsia sp. Leaf354]KQR96287.1 cytochrome C biogenesis protein ResB [Williamsia sp. Leaf354]
MTDTIVRDATPAASSPPPVWKRRLLWPARNLWRSLTSMRTALALLFLLALAAVPGALLPQRSLNSQKTEAYIDDHGLPARILDRLQFFEVFSSVWFTAIYVLLFISLVGCLTPRLIEHGKALRATPVAAPRNFTRLPRHDRHEVDGAPSEIADRVMGNLRGWRRTQTTRSVTGPDGEQIEIIEISAEKGYLREFGNLVFHFALLALLVSIAAGKMWGYEGTRILVADGQQGLCNTSTAVYDSFRGGNLVDGTDLAPFCVQVDDFTAKYLPSGQADMYSARVDYQAGSDLENDRTTSATLKVNDPLRVAGDRVYLLGHGYAPTFTVTFPGGEKRTQTVPFTPNEAVTLLSSGAARFDTPAGLYPNADVRRKNQIAVEGLFAPTALLTGATGSLLSSSFPEARDPQVAIRIYKGDTGLDTGRPQNVYSLDQNLINQGRLLQKAQVNLAVGQSSTIDDGTTVRFDGYQQWVSLQVSHDPAQQYVLISAIAMLVGLLVSLLIKRRRVWARITPADSSRLDSAATDKRLTVVEMAGLARTDQAGWGEGFGDLVRRLLEIDPPGARSTRTGER